jgi:hypothetical protein
LKGLPAPGKPGWGDAVGVEGGGGLRHEERRDERLRIGGQRILTPSEVKVTFPTPKSPANEYINIQIS